MKNVLLGLSSILDTEENKGNKRIDRILAIFQTEAQNKENPEKDGSLVNFGTIRDDLTYIKLEFHKKT